MEREKYEHNPKPALDFLSHIPILTKPDKVGITMRLSKNDAALSTKELLRYTRLKSKFKDTPIPVKICG